MSKFLKLLRKKWFDWLLKIALRLAAVLTIGVLFIIVGYILIRGIPTLEASMFAFKFNSDNQSMFPALISTVIITLISLVLAVPLGVFSAIYLVEYAKRGNKAVGVIRVTAETLSGIPSIVYGLFGFLFFVIFMKWGNSVLAGSFTLAIMILPLIMRTTEEALKSVPDSFREGSFGLGAGRLRTVFRIVLPSAMPGILAGVILGIGRIVGETAALLYTAGTVAQIPSGLNVFTGDVFWQDSARTLSVHMYSLYREGLYIDKMYGTAVILLLLVIVLNTVSTFIAKKLTKK
ncbi:MAG: phosphate ABC transporter permease PstA [Oscillospiraceae bacterium]|nr:phosphate ABC transporter permease PstA [Oscillospiraceae bacterium]